MDYHAVWIGKDAPLPRLRGVARQRSAYVEH